jgi:hypothetical protein
MMEGHISPTAGHRLHALYGHCHINICSRGSYTRVLRIRAAMSKRGAGPPMLYHRTRWGWVGWIRQREEGLSLRETLPSLSLPATRVVPTSGSNGGRAGWRGGCSGGIGYHMSLSTLDDAGVCQLFVYKQIKNQQPSLMVIDDWCWQTRSWSPNIFLLF